MPLYVPAVVPYVTALPSSPYDGQEVYYGADPTNGVIWHLRYRAAASGSFKWEFVGGSDLDAIVDTSQTTASTTFVDLATVGPSITLPLGGDYDFSYGDEGSMGSTSAFKVIALLIAGSEVTADELVVLGAGPLNGLTETSRIRRKTALSSGNVVKLQYRVTGSTGTFRNRWLRARPVRVG